MSGLPRQGRTRRDLENALGREGINDRGYPCGGIGPSISGTAEGRSERDGERDPARRALGRAWRGPGIPGLAFDAAGSCRLAIDALELGIGGEDANVYVRTMFDLTTKPGGHDAPKNRAIADTLAKPGFATLYDTLQLTHSVEGALDVPGDDAPVRIGLSSVLGRYARPSGPIARPTVRRSKPSRTCRTRSWRPCGRTGSRRSRPWASAARATARSARSRWTP